MQRPCPLYLQKRTFGFALECPLSANSGHWSPPETHNLTVLLVSLYRVLHVFDFINVDIDNFPVDFFDAANVNRLHNVTRVRIDQHGAARTLPAHPFCCLYQTVTVSLSTRLLQRLID